MKALITIMGCIIFGTSLSGQVTFTFDNNKQGLETSGEDQNNTVIANAEWNWGTYNAKCDGSSGGAAGGGYDFAVTGYFSHAYGFGGDPGAKYLMNLGASGSIADQYYLDLSVATNQKLKFSGSLFETNGSPNFTDVSNSNFSQEIIVELYGRNYNIVATKTITMTNVSTDYEIDFSDAIAEPTAMDSIRQISFSHSNCGTVKHSNSYRFYASTIKVGSFAATSTQNASIIEYSSVFPNPSNGSFSIQLELQASSDITIDLVDVNGKLVQEIFSGNYKSIQKVLYVPNNAKGIYMLRYTINGVPVKSELLSIQ